MNKFFKLVCINENNENFMIDELKNGKLRYGWSWGDQNSDLRFIKDNWEEISDKQKLTWTKTKFLLKRIKIGDYIIIQLQQPLKEFFLAKVVGEYTYSTEIFSDFNHVIPVELITKLPIQIDSSEIPFHVRHDLTKRGRYYEIYPENTIQVLKELIQKVNSSLPIFPKKRSAGNEIEGLNEELTKKTKEMIRGRFQSKYFEHFIKILFDEIEGIEITDDTDHGKGWDKRLRILDPITNETLYENVPIQCKNYDGEVNYNKPFEDLDRAIENLEEVKICYLAIMGKLSEEFNKNKLDFEERNPEITLYVLDDDRIAELYLERFMTIENKLMAKSFCED